MSWKDIGMNYLGRQVFFLERIHASYIKDVFIWGDEGKYNWHFRIEGNNFIKDSTRETLPEVYSLSKEDCIKVVFGQLEKIISERENQLKKEREEISKLKKASNFTKFSSIKKEGNF